MDVGGAGVGAGDLEGMSWRGFFCPPARGGGRSGGRGSGVEGRGRGEVGEEGGDRWWRRGGMDEVGGIWGGGGGVGAGGAVEAWLEEHRSCWCWDSDAFEISE